MPRITLADRQVRLSQQRARLQAEQAKVRDAERKARTRQLIELGGLIDKAGLGDLEPAALYGALLSLADQAKDAGAVERWAALGGRAFARDERDRDATREPLVLTFAAPPPAHVSTRLRSMGFRWSKVMGHWEGLADADAADALAREHGGTLRRLGGNAASS